MLNFEVLNFMDVVRTFNNLYFSKFPWVTDNKVYSLYQRMLSYLLSSFIGPFYLLLCVSYYFFFFLRAAPAAYRSSQTKGWIGAAAASLHHNHSNTSSELGLWPTLQLRAMPGSLTHWAGPGIEPTSSWILVGFITTVSWRELPAQFFNNTK